jgi:hypothetical protein
MTLVLKQKRLAIVSYCHLPPISIRASHTPPDPKLFPAAKGFEEYSVTPKVGWFGGKFSLVGISDLTRSDLEERLPVDHPGSRAGVEAIRFLQCLEWIHKGIYVEKFSFERIAAYPIGGEPVVAARTESGFKRVLYLGDDTPWQKGTLGLFYIDSL